MSEEKAILDKQTGFWIFKCPNCGLYVEVAQNEVNCAIFRHANIVIRDPNGTIILSSQVNPHESKEVCERLIQEGKIVGCGKPFRMSEYFEDSEKFYIVKNCDYI